MTAALLLLALAVAQAAPDQALYLRARAHMAGILANQTNYTCLETIDRSVQTKPKAKFETIDSLRFEVAFVDKKELYAWPGSKKFDDTSILDMVPEGSSIATGAFAGHAQYLFQSNLALIGPGEWILDPDGKRYARYPFTVPVDRSRYLLMKSRNDSAVVGYSGEIRVDPTLERVTRIAFHADAIPSKLNISDTGTTIEYASAKIGERDFWLPSRSIEEITTPPGRVDRNVTRFSGCRAFTGESTLRFDEVLPETPAAPAPPQTIDLPPGLFFEIQFDAPVDSLKTHVGDLIPARLTSDIKQKGHLLFPKGSSVEIRLVRIQRRPEGVSFEFAIGEVSSQTALARLVAIPDTNVRTRAGTAPGGPVISGDSRRPGIGVFTQRGNRASLRDGLRSIWYTTAPAPKTDH